MSSNFIIKPYSNELLSQWNCGEHKVTLNQKSLQVEIEDKWTSGRIHSISKDWIKGIPPSLNQDFEKSQHTFMAFCRAVYPLVHHSKQGFSVEFLSRGLGAGKKEVDPEEAAELTDVEKSEFANLMANPDDLCCPLTLELLVEPVVDALGDTYENKSIPFAV